MEIIKKRINVLEDRQYKMPTLYNGEQINFKKLTESRALWGNDKRSNIPEFWKERRKK